MMKNIDIDMVFKIRAINKKIRESNEVLPSLLSLLLFNF